MPHRADIQPDLNLVVVHAWGDITQDEIETALNELPQMKGFRPGLKLLVDFRDCTTSIGWSQVWHLASFAREREGAWGRTKWAMVVSSDLIFGLVRVFVALSNQGDVKSQVFRDIEAAVAWLEADADAAAALERLAAALAARETDEGDCPPPGKS